MSLKYFKYHFAESPFENLMQKRIHNVLLVCSTYDFFMLAEDGRIDEQIFKEYVSLSLRFPPCFIHVLNAAEAFYRLENESIDLVIIMLSVGGMNPYKLSKEIKRRYPDKPIVVLTPFLREITLHLAAEDLSSVDYVFSWLGNADILLAIIKLIEDKMNAEYDVHQVGVQVILLVEDSVRFYSSYLPLLYKLVLEQSREFMVEGLNDHQKMLRMRGRPKILFATNYEDAYELFSKYKSNLLGVISDVSYPHHGIKDSLAGIKLIKTIQESDPFLPLLLQSSDERNAERAQELNIGFINKGTQSLLLELKNFIKEHFSFGDLIFRDPDTNNEITRASDLKSLQDIIRQIPENSLSYHLSRNHVSKWLNARALFTIAEHIRYLTLDDFTSIEHARDFIFNAIANYRITKGLGIIAQFYNKNYDEYLIFSRIGEGSLGGKARGLAFLDSVIKKHLLLNKYEKALITIPVTVVLTTEVFDIFMEENDLYHRLDDLTDDEILNCFLNARMPERFLKDLEAYAVSMNRPVAVRSSSLLEDSYYQPFSGIYSTCMIPGTGTTAEKLEMLVNAIKKVYASVFFQNSRSYRTATSNVIDQEKMAVVLQTVCGNRYNDKFYPLISGCARSVNYYPIQHEKPEDGIVNLAFGFGKYLLDQNVSLRFSPKYPAKILQLSSAKMALHDTQKNFYALNLNSHTYYPAVNDADNLLFLKIQDAVNDNVLHLVCSTYDYENETVYDGIGERGKKIITFSRFLKFGEIPLAEIITDLLEISRAEMNQPVEIEFAIAQNKGELIPYTFNLLQIKPIVDSTENIRDNLELVQPENCIITCKSALGNGIINDIYDIVYIKPESFNAAENNNTALQIEELNKIMAAQKRNYILIGPGRWGSGDSWLGIPVKWQQISEARVIIESGLDTYRIDPSQGTHFLQNLIAHRVGYLTINPYLNDGTYDLDYLNSLPAVFENSQIRHVQFNNPLITKMDGRKRLAVIFKP